MNSTLEAGNLINQLDPYHPVSLVLNCYDYYFEEYTQGATILMHVSILLAYSPDSEHNTDSSSSNRIPTRSVSTLLSPPSGVHRVTPLMETAAATTVMGISAI